MQQGLCERLALEPALCGWVAFPIDNEPFVLEGGAEVILETRCSGGASPQGFSLRLGLVLAQFPLSSWDFLEPGNAEKGDGSLKGI